MTWKAGSFVDVPDSVLTKARSITVEGKTRIITLENEKDVSIFMRVARPTEASPKFHVLFLHGASFTSENWKELNTLQLVAAMGCQATAIDLPGRGNSAENPSVADPGRFLGAFINQEHLDRPVIVSPSMSGSFSLPYIMADPHTCQERLRGFVPIAPVGTGMYTNVDYQKCQIPVMILLGSRDQGLGVESLSKLRNIPNSEHFVLDDAGHACYMNKPAEWHVNLYNFLLAVESYG